MCLESKILFPRIAKEDIIVGKWLSLSSIGVVTYYQRYPVRSLKMKEKFPLSTVLKMFVEKRRHEYSSYKLEKGMFHSYNLNTMNYFTRQQFETGTIENCNMYVKAIIPKGALYYKDYWGDSYASNILILKPTEEQLKLFKLNNTDK